MEQELCGVDACATYGDTTLIPRWMVRSIAAASVLMTACMPPECPPGVTQPGARVAPVSDRLSEKQALRDLKILERALTELHPGLYRYLTPEGLQAEMARARSAVAGGADRSEMYLLVTRVGAAVRCGHTWTNLLNQSELVKQQVFGRRDKLPFRVRQAEGRFAITASKVAKIPAGSELLAIDGHSIADVIAELMPYLRADGGNDGHRLSELDSGDGGALDRLWPLLHPPGPGGYAVRVRAPVGAVTEQRIPAMAQVDRDGEVRQPEDGGWRLAVDGDIATLILPTFSFWRSSFDWAGFLERTFRELEARNVRDLVIDERDNEGGDGAVGDALLSYLVEAPFQPPASRAEVAYERVSYATAKFLDTWDTSFFDRTGQVTRTGARTLTLAADRGAHDLITPAAHRFTGRSYMLVGPANSSAGFIVAELARLSRSSTLIGQETGGNQRGINGGDLAWLVLPESGVALDIPLIAWHRPAAAPDAGITPDIVVPRRFIDLVEGRDAEIAAARAAIVLRRQRAAVGDVASDLGRSVFTGSRPQAPRPLVRASSLLIGLGFGDVARARR